MDCSAIIYNLTLTGSLRMIRNFGKAIVVILAFVAVMGMLPFQSQALTFYDSRANMPKDDFVDWGTFGSGVANSSNGVMVTVHAPFAFSSYQGYWLGNFAPGEHLLVAGGTTEIAFSRPVSSVGAQIQSIMVYGSFTGTVEAFDVNHVSLGSFAKTGYFNGIPNAAMFMGVSDSQDSIAFVDFSVSSAGIFGNSFNMFALNRLDFDIIDIPGSVDPPGSVVPLPGSLLFLGSGLLGLAGIHYTKS
jgi:hypothetical protein